VQFLSENEEKTSRNSSPTSHDSGIPSDSESNLTSNIEEDKLDDSSGVSIGSDRVVSKPKKSRKTRRAPQPPKLKTRAPPPPPPPPSTKNNLGFSEIISTSTSPDSLDLNEDLIPQAPPLLDSSLIDPLQIGQHVYESRKSQILNAKGTLKAPKNNKQRKNSIISDEISSFQFFLHEKDFEEHSTGEDSTSLVSEEDFAGIKDQWTRTIPEDGSLTIRSHRGTIRGVKNRVRAGIATFLRDPSFKNFGDREQRVVVIYVTTLSILRDTWARCVKVRQILRNLLIKVDERDVFMSRENQVELMDRMAMVEVNLPQVFVNGQYLGDADVIEKLNETGELRKILRPYKSLTVTTVCGKCGGFRMLPCPICDGSKKSMHRNDFTEQFIALRCTVCDDCGLVKCDKC